MGNARRTLRFPRRHLWSVWPDQAYHIEQLIVDGTLLPGDLLPAERELSKRLHVSRPSLREALLKLEARGLLRAGRGGSLAVTDVSAPIITDPLVHLLHRHAKAAQDVQGVRHGLEVMAAYHAAINATEADRHKLRKIFSKVPKDGSKHDALADADIDTDFHMTIAEASKNVALVHIVHEIFRFISRSYKLARDGQEAGRACFQRGPETVAKKKD
jgi:GntR family transcriptional repressor for pyruvate dehydrogenase complex